MTKFPTIFLNHGGGPLPLLGRQPELAQHMKHVPTHLADYPAPQSIVVVSAHWESDPVKITSCPAPGMLYDYSGFPSESYEYQYPAPGQPQLACKIQQLLTQKGIQSELDPRRGFDHGVFVPLMLMYPNADIPVVCVSLHRSLDAKQHFEIGSALQSLRETEGILIVGSGYTFHNMEAFFHPSTETRQASKTFSSWLKDAILQRKDDELVAWERAPGARTCHPREEHLLPLMVVAGAAGRDRVPEVIYDTTTDDPSSDHCVTSFLFR